MLCPETQISIYIWPPSEVMVGGGGEGRREEGAVGVQGQRKLKKKIQ